MFRNLSLVSVISIAAISFACTTANAPSNTAATNATTTTVPANLPPEFNANNITTNSTAATPGIPDPKTMTANTVPKGAATTPGIPSPEDLKKPQPKNTPPIPGIPSEKELKEQMNRKVDPSEVNNPKGLVPPSNASNTASNGTIKTVKKP